MSRVEGKQNSLFPLGPVIKYFVIPPNSKIEQIKLTYVSNELSSVLFSPSKLCGKFCSLKNSYKVLTAFCDALFVDFEHLFRINCSISSSVWTWKRFAAMTEKKLYSWRGWTQICRGFKTHDPITCESKGGVAAVVRSSTIGPLNYRTNKRNKERDVKTIELLHKAVQWKYKLVRGATLLESNVVVSLGR